MRTHFNHIEPLRIAPTFGQMAYAVTQVRSRFVPTPLRKLVDAFSRHNMLAEARTAYMTMHWMSPCNLPEPVAA